MRCTICGAETYNNDEKCSACQQSESNMKVLTPEEEAQFTGVTIEAEPSSNQSNENKEYQYNGAKSNNHVYIRQMSFGSKTSLFTKLLIFAIIAGILFIALPVAILFFGIVSILWFIFRGR